MIKCYVKGGSFVKPFLRLESMLSGKERHGWLPAVASVATGFRWVDSLDSKRNPPWPPVWSRKILKLSHNFRQGRWGGFQVMEWMPPSLTASQCAKLEVLQPKRMEGGIHEGS